MKDLGVIKSNDTHEVRLYEGEQRELPVLPAGALAWTWVFSPEGTQREAADLLKDPENGIGLEHVDERFDGDRVVVLLPKPPAKAVANMTMDVVVKPDHPLIGRRVEAVFPQSGYPPGVVAEISATFGLLLVGDNGHLFHGRYHDYKVVPS